MHKLTKIVLGFFALCVVGAVLLLNFYKGPATNEEIRAKMKAKGMNVPYASQQDLVQKKCDKVYRSIARLAGKSSGEEMRKLCIEDKWDESIAECFGRIRTQSDGERCIEIAESKAPH